MHASKLKPCGYGQQNFRVRQVPPKAQQLRGTDAFRGAARVCGTGQESSDLHWLDPHLQALCKYAPHHAISAKSLFLTADCVIDQVEDTERYKPKLLQTSCFVNLSDGGMQFTSQVNVSSELKPHLRMEQLGKQGRDTFLATRSALQRRVPLEINRVVDTAPVDQVTLPPVVPMNLHINLMFHGQAPLIRSWKSEHLGQEFPHCPRLLRTQGLQMSHKMVQGACVTHQVRPCDYHAIDVAPSHRQLFPPRHH